MRSVLFGLLLIAGCASARLPEDSAAPSIPAYQPQRLLLENASPDAVRVYLEVSGREVLLGRMGPFERAPLRIPAGVVHMGSGDARIVVLPLATPQPIVSGRNSIGIRSDTYLANEFLQTSWRYSGGRIVMVLTPRQ